MKTRTPRLQAALAVLAALPAAAMLLLATGCHEDNMVENHATDNAFIRLPGQKEDSVKIGPGELFPMHTGDRWSVTVQNSHNADQISLEEIVDTGTMTLNGVTGHVFELRRDGKTYREEVYGTDAAGNLLLMASGSQNDLMVMAPPIPLFHQPATDGEAVKWEGLLHFKSASSPASALSRVTGRNVVDTGVGKFNAFRIDTMITTTINSQPAAFPVKRWVAPGVGTVQEQMIANNDILTRRMQKFTAGKN